MKTSEIYKEGSQIIKDIYYPVLATDDKELWKKAIDSMMKRISVLEHQKAIQISEESLEARETIKQIWFWEAALDQLVARYGRKFVKVKKQK